MIHKNVNIYLLNLLIKFAELKMEKKNKYIMNVISIFVFILYLFLKLIFQKYFMNILTFFI